MSAIQKHVGKFTEAEVGDEIVIMRLDTGDFFSLSGTGAAVWRLIDGTRDRQALIAELAKQFDGQPAGIVADVDAFLDHLRDMSLLGH